MSSALVRLLLLCAGCMVICASALLGQGATLVGAGYANPASIRVAPGQITTIFATGLNPDFSQPQVATTLPLPTTLGGIAVTVNQASPQQSLMVPLLSVAQVNLCGNHAGTPECLLTAVTLQIPYELSIDGDFSLPGTTSSTELVISVNGTNSRSFSITAVPDNLH